MRWTEAEEDLLQQCLCSPATRNLKKYYKKKKTNHKRKFSVFVVGERSKRFFLSLAHNRRM